MPTNQYALGGYSTLILTPDLKLLWREVAGTLSSPKIDMGAFETQPIEICSNADIAPQPCPDLVVNVRDLLEIIVNWGTCPAAPHPCWADITGDYSGQSPPDGTVNVIDLVRVIGAWGATSCYHGGTYDPGSITSVQDCMDHATNELELTPHGVEWNAAVADCIDALCKAEIIDCD